MSETRPRVLWLSNGLLESVDRGVTGTWLHAMADGLLKAGRIELGNITAGKVSELTRSDADGASQWIVPAAKNLGKDGLPDGKVVAAYLSAISEFNPDLIHVWGAETFPGLLTARGFVKCLALLEMQGLKGPLAQLYHGELTLREQLKCIGPKEIIRRSTIAQQSASFRKWGVFEQEMMRKHRFITAPSPWMAAHARAANPAARLFQNEIPLRKALFSCLPWTFTGAPIIFCSSSHPLPYKGLHTVIRAAKALRNHFPNIRVRIAGAHQADGFRRSGYVRWLNNEIRRHGLEPNIRWLGSIDSEQLCEELTRASLAVFPSYAESYGVAHAEAMTIGVPTVCAFNGGSTYLAENRKSALFFPAGDHVVCASQIKELIERRDLAEALGQAARTVALRRHDLTTIVDRQLQIYEECIRDSATPPV